MDIREHFQKLQLKTIIPKTKTITITMTPTERKSRGYLILDITFTSVKNLQSILCQNKPKLLPNSHPGVYQLDCSCNGRYIVESKKKVLRCCIEHQQDSIKGNQESSGAIEHTKECHGQFNWIHWRTITLMSNMYKRKVREVIEINRLKALNETDKSFKQLGVNLEYCPVWNYVSIWEFILIPS